MAYAKVIEGYGIGTETVEGDVKKTWKLIMCVLKTYRDDFRRLYPEENFYSQAFVYAGKEIFFISMFNKGCIIGKVWGGINTLTCNGEV